MLILNLMFETSRDRADKRLGTIWIQSTIFDGERFTTLSHTWFYEGYWEMNVGSPLSVSPFLLLHLKVQGRTAPRHILATSNASPSSPGLNSPQMDWCKVKVDVLFWQAHMLNWMSSRLKRTGMVWWCVRVSGVDNVHTCGGPINAEGCKQVLEQPILPSTAVTTAWLHRK